MLPRLKTFETLPELVNEFFENPFLGTVGRTEKTWSPSVNIAENEDEFTIELALPGLKKENVNINLENDVLTISSEDKSDKEEKGKHYSRREFNYSSFKRSFTLPDTVDTDKVKARSEHGVLYIHIPKREEAKPKPPKNIEIS